MGKVFKWYFVVPEGLSEWVCRGIRKALEMPFFASGIRVVLLRPPRMYLPPPFCEAAAMRGEAQGKAA